ncbi:hypothetical protein GCM10007385_18380 [Tateyamaria omphalii]|uniref:hypothetical protein n=1 Tax=Tateyamaria omphalii TaxID=299262 RepID=UPI001997BF53|nr:hypothetical protein [Tateyamaria omphalii]GGX50276.1 hypothetical protein GCM10007385_18380 [Tateyamaria omphalii]
MRHFPLTIMLFCIGTSAYAQDIRWKLETFKSGDYVSIDQSQNGLIHHVFRGKVGPSFVLESFSGPAPQGTPVFTTYLDRDGNHVRWVRKDGFEVAYTPHDCSRTQGRCQYTSIDTEGKREVRLRITKPTRKGFAFDEYDADGKRLSGGRFALDGRGTAGNGTITGNRGTNRYRLIRQVYQ